MTYQFGIFRDYVLRIPIETFVEEGDEPTEHPNPKVGQVKTTKPKLAIASVKKTLDNEAAHHKRTFSRGVIKVDGERHWAWYRRYIAHKKINSIRLGYTSYGYP